ncbi:MAG: hypothetical protein J6Q73_01505 [Bacteroidaceae bacterium]|nr:hypothetical protein [Bacteroidaceae bacterium]
MKAELYSKISKYVLYALAAIILVVFVLFFLPGEPLVLEQVSEAGEVTELPYPQYMEVSLYLCYALCFVALLLVLVFEMVAAVKKMASGKYAAENDANKTLNVAKKVVWAVLAVVVVVMYFVAASKLDYVLFLQYALFGISALCMLGSFAISKIRS